jgi:transcriptional regulator with XRE-family HTH domain
MRVVQGKTLREIAREMKVSAPYLCDLELGRRGWSEDLRLRFKRAVSK